MAHNAVDLRSGRVNVRRSGKGDPLLFLHGAQGLSQHEPLIEALARQFDVIAPEHPGFGASESSDAVDDIADLSLCYLDLLDALKLDRAHVVGHCIGGWAAMEMAVRASHRFRSLVLVNSAGIRLKGVPRGDMFVCSEDDLLKMLFAGEGAGAWLRAWRATPESEDLYDRNRAAAAKYSWSPRLCNPKLSNWLHRVHVPTHIVWGAEDRVIPPEYGAALKELIQGASIAVVPECAHLATHEKPQAIAEQVSSFIRRAAA